MPNRPCPVCHHDSRLAIEQAILNGKTLMGVAKDFGFTYTARTGRHAGEQVPNHKPIQIHRDQHMGTAYQRAMEEREVQSGVAIAKRLEYLEEQVDTVITRANEGAIVELDGVPLLDDDGTPLRRHDNRLLLAAVREGRHNLELLAKLAGAVENDPAELDKLRAYLESPQARRLLSELDRIAMEQEQGQT